MKKCLAISLCLVLTVLTNGAQAQIKGGLVKGEKQTQRKISQFDRFVGEYDGNYIAIQYDARKGWIGNEIIFKLVNAKTFSLKSKPLKLPEEASSKYNRELEILDARISNNQVHLVYRNTKTKVIGLAMYNVKTLAYLKNKVLFDEADDIEKESKIKFLHDDKNDQSYIVVNSMDKHGRISILNLNGDVITKKEVKTENKYYNSWVSKTGDILVNYQEGHDNMLYTYSPSTDTWVETDIRVSMAESEDDVDVRFGYVKEDNCLIYSYFKPKLNNPNGFVKVDLNKGRKSYNEKMVHSPMNLSFIAQLKTLVDKSYDKELIKLKEKVNKGKDIKYKVEGRALNTKNVSLGNGRYLICQPIYEHYYSEKYYKHYYLLTSFRLTFIAADGEIEAQRILSTKWDVDGEIDQMYSFMPHIFVNNGYVSLILPGKNLTIRGVHLTDNSGKNEHFAFINIKLSDLSWEKSTFQESGDDIGNYILYTTEPLKIDDKTYIYPIGQSRQAGCGFVELKMD